MKRAKAYKSHILKKSTKRKRDLDQGTYVSRADLRQVRAMLPYGS